MRREELVGRRVKLIKMEDPRPIPPGTEGLIKRVDTKAKILVVHWDNGRVMNLVEADKYRII